MRKLTALLIVRNEETMLPACLDSLVGVVDGLAVVDTGSTDGTVPLLAAESLRDRFESVVWEQHPFADFADARNRALALVDTPWCLWIDADERLSPELADELRQALESGGLDAAGAWSLPFQIHVLGRRMTCRELSGQRHVRLFRTEGATFEGAVHEAVALPDGAQTGRVLQPVEHHTMTSWRSYWLKVMQYTAHEASTGSWWYSLGHLPIAIPAVMWRMYLWRGCWRDGWPGFVWAATAALGSVVRDWRRLVRRA